MLRRHCAAYLIEVEELFRRLVFSYAIGNGDAHLKNFSVQHQPAGDYLLSPAYDLVASSIHLPNKLQGPLPIDSLIALAALRDHRRLTRAELAEQIQKADTIALATLEHLVERGLVQPHGRGRGRSYTLSAQVYASQGRQVAYTRQAGFDQLQQEQMVLGFARQHGEIRRSDVMELCHLTGDQASRLLRRMTDEGALIAHGERRWRYYTPNGDSP